MYKVQHYMDTPHQELEDLMNEYCATHNAIVISVSGSYAYWIVCYRVG